MNTETENNLSPADQGRRKGNVARLSKPLRDLVNSMLDDGKSYPEIVTALENSTDPKLPHPVTARNISNWFDGGYQDYLRNQAWRERIDAKADRYLDVGINDGAKLAAGGLYSAAIQICEIMDDLAASSPGETDADKCARVTNSLSRLSRSILMLQQHREAIEKAKAAELQQLDPKRELGQDETLAIVDQVNKLFGLRQYRKPRVAPADSLSSSGGESRREEASASQISNSEPRVPQTNN